MKDSPQPSGAPASAGALLQQLQLAVQAARMGIWNLDPVQRTLSSPLGSGPLSSLAATPRPFLELVCEEDRAGAERDLHRALESGEFMSEFRVVLPDGSRRWVRACGRCVRDGSGRPTMLTGVDLDITDRRRADQALRREQAFQDSMEAIGHLAAGVAHDFNNLLTVIQGNASLLLDVRALSEDDRLLVRQITEAAERASGLTHQLLVFGRKHAPRPVIQDFNQTIRNLLRVIQDVAGEGVRLELALSDPLPPVNADTGMLEQLLLNLTSNARDAMPSGGTLAIATSAVTLGEHDLPSGPDPVTTPGPYVRLEVRDTGCGIPPEDLSRIFEPFFSTKEVGKGTGLGLATVYGIVRQHQGSIEALSKPGSGTTFRVLLPACTSPAEEPKAAAADASLPRGTETILVVEDEKAVRLLIVNLLSRHGYTVVSAGNGPEALDAWKLHGAPIHLVLTDMVMPGGLTGRELAERLRGLDPRLKVIYSSGYSGELLGKGSALVEGVNFLRKPYPSAKLLQAIRKSLDQA